MRIGMGIPSPITVCETDLRVRCPYVCFHNQLCMHMYLNMIISLAGMGMAVPFRVYWTGLWVCDVEYHKYFQLPSIQGMLC